MDFGETIIRGVVMGVIFYFVNKYIFKDGSLSMGGKTKNVQRFNKSEIIKQ